MLDVKITLTQIFSKIYRVICEYSQFDRVKYNFDKWGVEVLDVEYTDICTLQVRVIDGLAGPFLEGEFYSRDEVTSRPTNLPVTRVNPPLHTTQSHQG